MGVDAKRYPLACCLGLLATTLIGGSWAFSAYNTVLWTSPTTRYAVFLEQGLGGFGWRTAEWVPNDPQQRVSAGWNWWPLGWGEPNFQWWYRHNQTVPTWESIGIPLWPFALLVGVPTCIASRREVRHVPWLKIGSSIWVPRMGTVTGCLVGLFGLPAAVFFGSEVAFRRDPFQLSQYLFGTEALGMCIIVASLMLGPYLGGRLTHLGLSRVRRRCTRLLRTREGLCVNCGYNLTGNTSGLCPECGARASED